MTVEEALKILDTIPTISEQVDALETAIRSLEAWEKVKKEIKEHSYYFQNDKYRIEKGMSLTGIMEIIDKALGEVGESE